MLTKSHANPMEETKTRNYILFSEIDINLLINDHTKMLSEPKSCMWSGAVWLRHYVGRT